MSDIRIMDINQERIDALSTLAASVTEGTWVYSDGVVQTSRGQLIARVGSGNHEPTFQDVVNGEFIAEMRNVAPYLLSKTLELQGVVERLASRVARLESKLYGES